MDRRDFTLQVSMSSRLARLQNWWSDEARVVNMLYRFTLTLDHLQPISQGDRHPTRTELLEHQVPSAHSRCDITRTHSTTPLSLQPSQVRLERHTKITWLSLENPCASAAKYSTYLATSRLTAKKKKKNKHIYPWALFRVLVFTLHFFFPFMIKDRHWLWTIYRLIDCLLKAEERRSDNKVIQLLSTKSDTLKFSAFKHFSIQLSNPSRSWGLFFGL